MSYGSSFISDDDINSFFQVATDWKAGSKYSDTSIVNNCGHTYVSILGETATAENQPGVGESWTDHWVKNSKVIPTISRLDEIRVSQALEGAEAAICNYINQDFGFEIHEQLLPANHYPTPRGLIEYPSTDEIYTFENSGNIHRVMLKHCPVHNDDTLTVYRDCDAEGGQREGAFGPESVLIQGRDYFLDITDEKLQVSNTGIIYLSSGTDEYPRGVKVWYTSGLLCPKRVKVMRDILLQVLDHVFQIRNGSTISRAVGECNPSGNQPLASESLGGYSYSVNTSLQSTHGTRSAAGFIPSIVSRQLHKFMKYGYIEG